MFFDEHDEWFDGFESWEEVWPLLQDDWMTLQDVRQRLEVTHGADGLLVYEDPRHRLRARQRRGLHRLGFRSSPLGPIAQWVWDVDAVLATVDVSAYEEMLDKYALVARPAVVAALRCRLFRTQLVTQQVQRVVQEVFRSTPHDVAIAIHRERDPWGDEWDEDEDESWPLPAD